MKRVIVTGATGAIGTEVCRALAACGYGLVLACRNEEAMHRLALALPAEADALCLHLDLADASSVDAAVAQLRAMPAAGQLVGIINNAGVMARQYSLAPGGHETDMCVNYHNTRRFTEGVLESGMLGRGGSIVFTTSLTRFLRRGAEIPEEPTAATFSRLGSYGASKRAITIYAARLSRRLAGMGIGVNCADPGVVNSGMITMHRWFDPLTDIFFRPFIRTPREGAIPALRAFEAGRASAGRARIYCRRAVHELRWAEAKAGR